MPTIGERIRRKRLNAGLTQVELSQKTNINNVKISNIEKDKSEPTEQELKLLKPILGKINKTKNNTITEEKKKKSEKIEENNEIEENISLFGEWLKKTRTGKKLSVPELSEKSSVTPPTIYAIEAGKIINPQDGTRKKLEKALGINIPDEITNEVENDSNISGIGELIDFNPHDLEDMPSEPGVYVLYDITERPVYVGQGQNIRNRLKDHEQKFWFHRPIVETAAFVKIEEKNQREKIESLLIKFLKSNAVLNKQNVDR